MTVDSASGTAGCHQIECAEPSPSECMNTASVYAPSSAAEGSILRRNGGNIEDLVSITCRCLAARDSQIDPATSIGDQDELEAVQGLRPNTPVGGWVLWDDKHPIQYHG